MMVARDFVLALTILAIIFTLDNWPKTVKAVQVDFCVIDYPAAAKDQFGNWQRGWARGFGPCSLQDKFFEI